MSAIEKYAIKSAENYEQMGTHAIQCFKRATYQTSISIWRVQSRASAIARLSYPDL